MRLCLRRIITFADRVTPVVRAAAIIVEYITGSGIDVATTTIADSVPSFSGVSRLR
jgi:hypothetical protein